MRSLVPDVSRFYECFILYVGFSILIFFYHSDLKILGLHHKVDQHAIVIYIKKGIGTSQQIPLVHQGLQKIFLARKITGQNVGN